MAPGNKKHVLLTASLFVILFRSAGSLPYFPEGGANLGANGLGGRYTEINEFDINERIERDKEEPTNRDTNKHTTITRAANTFNFSLPSSLTRRASEEFRDGDENMMGESEWFQFLADLQEELAKRMERDNKEPANTDTNEHTIITRAITFNFSLPANFKRAASERFRDGGEKVMGESEWFQEFLVDLQEKLAMNQEDDEKSAEFSYQSNVESQLEKQSEQQDNQEPESANELAVSPEDLIQI